MSRYIFNPQHDLCLASGDADYIPPASALEFARKCGWVERFMGDTPVAGPGEDDAIVPWGWNAVLRNGLLREGIPASILPTDAQLCFIRECSRREVAVQLLEYLYSSFVTYEYRKVAESGSAEDGVSGDGAVGKGKVCGRDMKIVPCGYRIVAKSLVEVERFVEERGKVVLKAPLSGSGKGVRFVAGKLMDTDTGWCRRILQRQGSVVVEERLDVLKEFAMLFRYASDSSGEVGVHFMGYSMFYSSNGAYKGNVLASNGYMEEMLGGYISVDMLRETCCMVERFLQEKLGGCGNLRGFVGIDQFVCRRLGGEEILYHPAVEMNLRMTMGHIARNIYDFHAEEFGLGEGTHCMEPARGIFRTEIKW